MKPPQNLATSRTRGLVAMRADLAHPRPGPSFGPPPRRLPPGLAVRPGGRQRNPLTECIEAKAKRERRPSLAERIRAGRLGDARLRDALAKGREDMARAAGDDPPAPILKRKLSPAELEKLARDYAARHGCDIRDARRAVAGGAR